MENKEYCFNKNNKVNYLTLLKNILDPNYFSNTSIILFLIFLFCKNGFLIHSTMPLIITNGLFIIYYLIFHFKGFKKEGLIYTCQNDDKDRLFNHIKIFNQEKKLYLYTIVIIIHFYPIIIYKLLINYNSSFKYLGNKSNTSIMSSIFINIIIILIFGLIMRKNQYIIVNLKGDDILKTFFFEYIPMLFTNTYLYFRRII